MKSLIIGLLSIILIYTQCKPNNRHQPYIDLGTEEIVHKGDILQVLDASAVSDGGQDTNDTIWIGYPSNPIVDMPEEPVSAGDRLQVLRVTKDTIYMGYELRKQPFIILDAKEIIGIGDTLLVREATDKRLVLWGK